jgi:hypothetical protein
MNTNITLKNYSGYHEKLKTQFHEFAQRKSDFQVEKFTACSDGTIPSHQYRHVLVQIRVALTELKRRIVDRERQIRTRDRAMDVKGEDWDLDVAGAETEIESLTYDIESKLIEVNGYAVILEQLEKENGEPFTNADFQADEPEYWKRRFARQMHDSVVDRQTGCGQGNLIALREACVDPILPESPNQLEILPMDVRILALIAEGIDLKMLEEGEKEDGV